MAPRHPWRSFLAALALLAPAAAPALGAVEFAAPVDRAVGGQVAHLAAAPSPLEGRVATVAAVTAATPPEVVLLHTAPGGEVAEELRLTLAGDAAASGIVLADVDGDEDLDALVPRPEAGAVTVVRHEGGALTQADVPAGESPTFVAAGRLDAGESLDLLVASDGPDGLVRLMGDGGGGFGAPVPVATAAELAPGGISTEGPALADVDADGDLDAVVGVLIPVPLPGVPPARTVVVLLGDGSGALEPGPAGVPVLWDLDVPGVLAELTGDGALDVLLRGRQAPIDLGFANPSQAAGVVLPGDGAGHFGPLPVEVGTAAWSAVGAAQLDGTGPADLLLLDARTATRRVAVSLAAGGGAFADPAPVPAPSATREVAAVDLDGDGALDLVTDRGLGAGAVAFLFSLPVVAGGADLGEVPIGAAAVAPVTVRNDGAAPLAAGSVRVAGAGAGEFAVVEDACSDTTLAPGASCEVRVSFRPAGAGAREAELVLGDTARGGPYRVALGGTGLVVPGPAAGEPRCLETPPPRTPDPPDRLSLTATQLRINQRIGQAAIRRLNAIQVWLDAGIRAGDICGGAFGAAKLAPGIATATATAPLAEPSLPAPRPLVVERAGAGGRPVRLSATQLLINQRIFQAAVRRANALTERLQGRLTGGDLADGALTQDKLAPRLRVLSAAPAPQPAPSRTVLAPRSAVGHRVTLTVRQLRINQRIAQAAVRRANALMARISAGLTADQFADGSITASDLAPALRGG